LIAIDFGVGHDLYSLVRRSLARVASTRDIREFSGLPNLSLSPSFCLLDKKS
jgi:hypothetical protein